MHACVDASQNCRCAGGLLVTGRIGLWDIRNLVLAVHSPSVRGPTLFRFLHELYELYILMVVGSAFAQMTWRRLGEEFTQHVLEALEREGVVSLIDFALRIVIRGGAGRLPGWQRGC